MVANPPPSEASSGDASRVPQKSPPPHTSPQSLPPPHSLPPPSTTASEGALYSARLPPLQPQNIAQAAPQSTPLSAPRSLVPYAENSPQVGARRDVEHRMRSSIACTPCRRSKIKCVNDGIHTRCGECTLKNKECTYETPAAPSNRASRRESNPPLSAENETRDLELPRRQRKKLLQPNPNVSEKKNASPRLYTDPLSAEYLTPSVWEELYRIFQKHYSADLPFLHHHVFTPPFTPIGLHPSQEGAPPRDRPAVGPELLLAYLALVGRFHDGLVAQCLRTISSLPRERPRMRVANHFATEAERRLLNISPEAPKGSAWGSYGKENENALEIVQALLMLGTYQWTNCNGDQVRRTFELAFDMAFSLDLPFEDEEGPPGDSSATQSKTSGPTSEHKIMYKEIRRRTFWSCFMIDCQISNVRQRPRKFDLANIRVKLPCNEDDFNFGFARRTGKLSDKFSLKGLKKEDGSRKRSRTSMENGAHVSRNTGYNDETHGEGALSQYIRVVYLTGDVLTWVCAKGRRQPRALPPWESESHFHQLDLLLKQFEESLPDHLQNTDSSVRGHAHYAAYKSSSCAFAGLHMLLKLDATKLHREYIPNFPNNGPPQGPNEAPTFNEHEIPDDWDWDKSAELCFKSAKSLFELADRFRLVTPLACYTLFIVAFTGMYAKAHPHMDTKGHMHSKEGGEVRSLPAEKALDILDEMAQYTRMAGSWLRKLREIDVDGAFRRTLPWSKNERFLNEPFPVVNTDSRIEIDPKTSREEPTKTADARVKTEPKELSSETASSPSFTPVNRDPPMRRVDLDSENPTAQNGASPYPSQVVTPSSTASPSQAQLEFHQPYGHPDTVFYPRSFNTSGELEKSDSYIGWNAMVPAPGTSLSEQRLDFYSLPLVDVNCQDVLEYMGATVHLTPLEAKEQLYMHQYRQVPPEHGLFV